MTGCSDLELFFDRELAEAEAEAFRAHLGRCARCQNKLAGLMQEARIAAEERTKRT